MGTTSHVNVRCLSISLAKVDGRSSLGKLMRQTRRDLVLHCGGRPTKVQQMLVERAVTLTGYLARLDAEALSPGGLSDHRRREYLAADSSLRRTLSALGTKSAPQREQSLTDYFAATYTQEATRPDREAA